MPYVGLIIDSEESTSAVASSVTADSTLVTADSTLITADNDSTI
jgi:hypothetical protein